VSEFVDQSTNSRVFIVLNVILYLLLQLFGLVST